ncbi:MAG: RdgB/HAM1 family non-canonical purine NTP pyrophosphatase [Methanomicrobiales archaeon]|nr:RdgB/HAM1 family non-canonical purine NTP pyrophosphatase [Methanomicrobiales archaeon]MDD1654930.1 RdgB/HAM1 family non-canonical purine NTP pyrophosphatase [Methanomicrobiales archaeon]
MTLAVVTGNPHKAREVAAFFQGMREVEHVPLDCPELKHDDVGEIARGKAAWAFGQLLRPLIVDDTGFSIHALGGFPGPYAAYVLTTLGNGGILKLLDGVTDRAAFFETAIAHADGEGTIRVFRGRIDGTITTSPRGTGGFGYDPIFEVDGLTLAELTLEEKSRISHRARALQALRRWLESPQQ